MIWEPPHINLLTAWVWILAGFASGALMGLRYAREDWLGGYTSLRRRMLRLGHISFFGLGAVNLLFYLTTNAGPEMSGPLLAAASWLFVLGALTMPLGCLAMVLRPETRPPLLFAVPVTALVAGGTLTVWRLLT